MSNFRIIARGVDVSGINAELEAHPELWEQNRYRIANPESPHHGVPDIWLRWRPAAELTVAMAHTEPHFSAFWPAWRMLPSLHPIVRNLSHVVNSTQLGGILITRIEPGASVKPHIDAGWHARFYDFKAYLCLCGNPGSVNWVEGEAFAPAAGDVFEFSNRKLHWVTNDGDTPRMTAIICFRTEP